MNEKIGQIFIEAIDALEAEVEKRESCCGCVRGEVEEKLESLRELVSTYSDGPKSPGY